MKLADFLVTEAILPNLASTIRDEALREIVSGLQDAGHLAGVDPESLTRALLEREGLGSTATGHGVAVPHAHLPSLDRVTGSIALAPHGVDFNALDGKPVDVLVTLFFPPLTGQPIRRDDPNEPFLAFEVVARHFEDDGFLWRLRQCRTREEVIGLVVEADRERPEIVTLEL